ncbi:MAG TPA: SpoIIE family protein phosphatase [Blastocatellia bacterium]|nr:SpoIIE family protein phosphatase [Blastocatellia bacterium]
MLSQVTSSTSASPVRRIETGSSAVEMNNHVLIEIIGTADVDEARRVGVDLARKAAFDDSVAERAALIGAEAAANILRHAGAGQILARVIGETEPAVEIIALDQGPGIAHLSAAMRGGYSNSGGSGGGLRTMSRASNLFDIFSRPGQGTALLAQVWARSLRYYATTRDYAAPRVKSGAISTAGSGASPGDPPEMRVIGDAWAAKHQPSRSLIMVANGLGQGEEAARTATEAVRVVEEVHRLAPAEILEVIHETLDGTRGASVAVAEIRLSNGSSEIRFAGVGNIAARVLNRGGAYHLASRHGIVGYEAAIEEFTHPWPPHSTLVMHSDGLSAGWNTEDYPGLLASHPALIAAVLHRDFNCGLDDATVVVAK